MSLTLGWRWTFAGAAALAAGIALFVPRPPRPTAPGPRRRARAGDAATAPLLALSVAAGVGAGAATALGAFLVEAAVADGVSVSAAGWLLVAGSVAGIFARTSVGWFADRRRGRALYTVSAMLVVGAAGYGMLALGGPVLLTLGTLLAYACGWGWTGLMMFAVVRFNPNAPGAASGIVQAGMAGGATLGPFAFGTVVTALSFRAAWSLAATAAFLSAGLVAASRTWLVRDRARRHASG